jgi:hypothetical protein
MQVCTLAKGKTVVMASGNPFMGAEGYMLDLAWFTEILSCVSLKPEKNMTFSGKAAGEDWTKPSIGIVRPLSLDATMLLIMACAASSVVAQTTMSLRRVLVLYSDERLLPANDRG